MRPLARFSSALVTVLLFGMGLLGAAGEKPATVSGHVTAAVSEDASAIRVDCDYPGGNVILDGIDGDRVSLHQDLRDTRGDWFYWNFRVTQAAGRTLVFQFTKSNVIGVRGPAVSDDGGKSWRWLGAASVTGKTFRYSFSEHSTDVRFCFAVPYTQEDLDRFLQKYGEHPNLEVATLCQSRSGRNVERLRLGRLKGTVKHRVLLTARHHACEMMASYTLEGLMAAVLSETDCGRWLRQNTEFLVIPFMDKDGVEEGDQGKNRALRDHNRDYAGESIHAEVRALRRFVPTWAQDQLHFALDLHDPYIRGPSNESIYLVENDGPTTENVRNFARILESSCAGPLPFRAKDNLPFGTSWNTAKNYADGMSFSRWAGKQPGIVFAATIEVPYANAGGQPVTAETARAFGRDLARAIQRFLSDLRSPPTQ